MPSPNHHVVLPPPITPLALMQHVTCLLCLLNLALDEDLRAFLMFSCSSQFYQGELLQLSSTTLLLHCHHTAGSVTLLFFYPRRHQESLRESDFSSWLWKPHSVSTSPGNEFQGPHPQHLCSNQLLMLSSSPCSLRLASSLSPRWFNLG